MRHIAFIRTKPKRSGKYSIPDGAITGNGDLAVILGNSDAGMRIYLSKIDLWYGAERANLGGMKPLGIVDIAIPKVLYRHYHVEQDMDLGELRCRFTDGGRDCRLTIRVLKTENAVVIRSGGDVPIRPVLKVFEGETAGRTGTFDAAGCSGIFRSFDGAECLYETHAFAALKQTDAHTFYLFAATNHDTPDPQNTLTQKMRVADGSYIEKKEAEHRTAWQSFWQKSAFTLSDRELELGWYAAQYFLAVSAGNPKFPPGIFANFITVERPDWHSDYHLNYNYQAPFYAACSSNHPELTDGYMTPLEEFYGRGKSFAEKFGCGGILYPVGIAPKGICTEWDPENKYSFERLFLGQKNNQIHPADIAVFRWYATRDLTFAREHAYPYLKACLAFFEDYGEWENGRFCICRDAAHEVPIYKHDFDPAQYPELNDKNNVVTLGMLRLGLTAAIDMAQALGADEEKQRDWEKLLTQLAPFPTYHRWGKRVYRYTEAGQRWNETGDVGLQHVYPAGCIGLSSDEKELKIARTTFLMKSRYCFDDGNAVSSFYPMAARLGMPPHKTLQKLKAMNRRRLLPNLLYLHGGGCLENCAIPASTLNEMALQSHQGVVRLFPCWDTDVDAKFTHLRADGAFLVSSSIQKGVVGVTTVIAEKGGLLRMHLPYRGAEIRHGGGMQRIEGSTFEMQTKPGEVITAAPVSNINV